MTSLNSCRDSFTQQLTGLPWPLVMTKIVFKVELAISSQLLDMKTEVKQPIQGKQKDSLCNNTWLLLTQGRRKNHIYSFWLVEDWF